MPVIFAAHPEEEFTLYDGLDKAVIGVDENSLVIIYSRKKCISEFIKQGMTYDDAVEWIDYNMSCVQLKFKTPIICDDVLIASPIGSGV